KTTTVDKKASRARTTKKNVEHFPKSSPVGVSLPSKALPPSGLRNNPVYQPAYVWTDEEIINIDFYASRLRDLQHRDLLLDLLSKCRTQKGSSFYVKNFDSLIMIANAAHQLQKHLDDDSRDFLEKIIIECLRKCSSYLTNSCSISKLTTLCNIIRTRDSYKEIDDVRSRIAGIIVAFRNHEILGKFHGYQLSITAAAMLKRKTLIFEGQFDALKAIAEEVKDSLQTEMNSWNGITLSTLAACIGCLKQTEGYSLPEGETKNTLLKKMCDAQEKIATAILSQYKENNLEDKKKWNIQDFIMVCSEFKSRIYRSDHFVIQQAIFSVIHLLNDKDLMDLENSDILIFVDACGESVFNSANSLLIFLTK
ncbi:hypothetical protein, partial [Parendozoicomonas sp. Alg238-R29]|uniref:hypothetical protein n=1 Tax=Parendozoicomonas sp. Alg238-R29 TaxID=2993446 RepID=UPI00248F20F4